MSLAITQIPVGGFDHNFAYLLSNLQTKETLIVDPSGNIELIYSEMERQGLTLKGIAITHTDSDHIDRLADVLALYDGLPIYVHETGAENIAVSGSCQIITLRDESEILLGETPITVFHTPGHTPDSVCFYIKQEHAADETPHLITGDTLFVNGCGRTTEAGARDLYDSLQRLRSLSARTIIYPGHDYGEQGTSTIGTEKKHNPYYKAADFRAFKKRRLG